MERELCVSCAEQESAMRKIIEAGEAEKRRLAEVDDRAFRNMAGLYTRDYRGLKQYREEMA